MKTFITGLVDIYESFVRVRTARVLNNRSKNQTFKIR